MTTVVEEEAVDNKVEETGAGADSGATTTDSAITESTSEAVAPEDVTNADSETSGDGEQPTDSTVTDDEDIKIVYPMVIDDITTDSPSDSEESTTPAGTSFDAMTVFTGEEGLGGESATKADDINPLNIPTTTVRTDDMTTNILVIEDMPTTEPGRDTIMETTATQDNMASDKSDDAQMETTTSKMMETSSKETEEMTTKMFETNELYRIHL